MQITTYRASFYIQIRILAIFISSIITTEDPNYDLMFIMDATTSITYFDQAFNEIIPQIYNIIRLTNIFKRVSVLELDNHCHKDSVIEWSGWKEIHEMQLLQSFVNNNNLKHRNFAFNSIFKRGNIFKAFEKLENKTICIILFDELSPNISEDKNNNANYEYNVKRIKEETQHIQSIHTKIHHLDVRIFPIYIMMQQEEYMKAHLYISIANKTGGKCFMVQNTQIVETVIGIISNLAGCHFVHDNYTRVVYLTENFAQSSNCSYTDSTKNTSTIYSTETSICYINEFTKNMENIAQKFIWETNYTELVFDVFSSILTKEFVIHLTYNTIYKKLWTIMLTNCSDAHLEILIIKLALVSNLVDFTKIIAVQRIISDSFNEIYSVYSFVKKYAGHRQFYIFDVGSYLENISMIEIGISWDVTVIRYFSKNLEHIRICDKTPRIHSGILYIPVGMKHSTTFTWLTQLIFPEVLFNYRLSFFVATHCIFYDSIFSVEAKVFLNESRGKWIDLSHPQNNTLEFSFFVIRASIYVLTDDEADYYEALFLVLQLKNCKNLKLNVQAGYSSNVEKQYNYKNKCTKCHQWRSHTQFTDKYCCICLNGVELLDDDNMYSLFNECKTCLVHYAVDNPTDLLCEAKCYHCLNGQHAPYIECKMCLNKFIHQLSERLEEFICAICKLNKGPKLQFYTITLEKYIESNGANFLGMLIKDPQHFFSDAYESSQVTADERLEIVRNFQEITEAELCNHLLPVGKSFKKVINVHDLQTQVYEAMNFKTRHPCIFCFKRYNHDDFKFICGNIKKGCVIKSCEPCLITYYRQIMPGKSCNIANFFCPFCKNRPNTKIVEQYNPMLINITMNIDINEFDIESIYAWCYECNRIKFVVRRECANENEDIENFRCGDCRKTTDMSEEQIRKCPSCNVLTIKADGCNHIYCINIIENLTGERKKCNAHWCWQCGFMSTRKQVYKHMIQIHGRYY